MTTPTPPPFVRTDSGPAPKSPGVAILLSILWLGAGHLYVDRVGLGVALVVFDFFLIVFSLIPFMVLLTVPVWFVAVAFVAFSAYRAAQNPVPNRLERAR